MMRRHRSRPESQTPGAEQAKEKAVSQAASSHPEAAQSQGSAEQRDGECFGSQGSRQLRHGIFL